MASLLLLYSHKKNNDENKCWIEVRNKITNVEDHNVNFLDLKGSKQKDAFNKKCLAKAQLGDKGEINDRTGFTQDDSKYVS